MNRYVQNLKAKVWKHGRRWEDEVNSVVQNMKAKFVEIWA